MTEPTSPCITKQFADFCLALKYEDLSPHIVTAGKHGILDLLGVALVGSGEKSTRMILKATAHAHHEGEATVLGTDTLTLATVAALVNGFAANALDYDDTYHDGEIHISTSVLPPALVVAETLHRSGKDLLTAYVTGFEIACRLSRVAHFGRQLVRRGVHPTGFLGHFGAVAAAGKLMDLSAPQMRRSFGIAANQTGGLVRSFGNMCYPLSAGNAAKDAVLSARLAKQGFTGPEEIFDGAHNILSIHGGQTDPEELVRGLGQQFGITGNTIKVFACAGWRNPIIEGLILLVTTHGLQPKDVKKVQVWVWSRLMGIPNYPEPRTGLEGKFSAQHAAAVAIVDRAGGIKQFTDERVADPVLIEFRRRVSVAGDESFQPWQTRVLIQTVDGREFSHFIPDQKGSPGSPLSWDDLVAKFSANALTVLPKRQVESLTVMIQNLDAVEDVAELTRLCVPRLERI